MNQAENEKSMRERMLAGEPYLADDPELLNMRRRAQRLLQEFNASTPDDTDRRTALLRDLLGALGSDCELKPPFYCDYGAHIRLGDGVFINYDCVILDCNVVRVGDRVQFGPKVQIYPPTHPLDPSERATGWESAQPVDIGDDVWIGGGAIVCPGVTIGEGTTIGAGSVVTRDVPANVVAAGNPCRVIREVGR